MTERILCVIAMIWIAGCGDNAATGDDELVDCQPGFVLAGGQCLDVDECATETADCDHRATCANTPGGFTCACPTDWSGDGTTCAPPPCRYQYDEGHGDIYATWADDALQLDLRSALTAGEPEARFAPLEVCINVPRSTYDEVAGLGGRPPGAGWDPIGVAEAAPFWYLPEQAIDGVPWFGIASDPSAIGGVPLDVFGPRLTLSISVDAPLGGQFSMWGTVDDAEHPPFLFSTAAGLAETEQFTSSHAHMSWGFTAPGEYLVQAQLAGTLLATGAVVRSEPVIFRFVVEP